MKRKDILKNKPRESFKYCPECGSIIEDCPGHSPSNVDYRHELYDTINRRGMLDLSKAADVNMEQSIEADMGGIERVVIRVTYIHGIDQLEGEEGPTMNGGVNLLERQAERLAAGRASYDDSWLDADE